jgi:hypothetical protein
MVLTGAAALAADTPNPASGGEDALPSGSNAATPSSPPAASDSNLNQNPPATSPGEENKGKPPVNPQ